MSRLSVYRKPESEVDAECDTYHTQALAQLAQSLQHSSMEQALWKEVMRDMTLVVAIIADDGIVVGADTLGLSDHLVRTRGKKIHSNGTVVIGYSGHESFCRRVIRTMDHPDENEGPSAYAEAISARALALADTNELPASFLVAGYERDVFTGQIDPMVYACRSDNRYEPLSASFTRQASIGRSDASA